jgi:hypothetical protein
MVVALVVLALGVIYIGAQVNALETRVKEIDWLVIETSITIDNGTDARTETVYMTRGATALEALNRIATVETKVYSFGVSVQAIDGLQKEIWDSEGMFWYFYTWNEAENKWDPIPVGVGKYELSDGENFKAVYEYHSW